MSNDGNMVHNQPPMHGGIWDSKMPKQDHRRILFRGVYVNYIENL